jgi:hypothetical protein
MEAFAGLVEGRSWKAMLLGLGRDGRMFLRNDAAAFCPLKHTVRIDG